MTTRLNLAAALAGEPSVLLLDEPAAALDPAGACWRLTVRPAAEPTIAALRAVAWAGSVVEGAPGEIEFTSPDADQVEIGLPGLLTAAGARLVSTAPLRPSLEEVFLGLTTSNRQGAGIR